MTGQPPVSEEHQPPRNRLLSAMTPEILAQIKPQLEPVSLERYHVLYEMNAPIRYIWFPQTAVVSWVALGSQGESLEVATIGNEGFVGVPSFLGVNASLGRWMVQISGSALTMRATTFRNLTREPGPLRDILGCYTQLLFNQMAQTALCNRIHVIEERCARWLLMTHDRVIGDEFFLTHEFLAQMLGVRRSGSVSRRARYSARD
jgi:CRP-like cAMP-binding protein